MKEEITENYLNVLRHRINKSDVPDIDRLKKIAPFIPKKELKSYVQKAKSAYSSLLGNNTKQSNKIATPQGQINGNR